MQKLSFVVLLTACLSLAGCGFKLRGSQRLPGDSNAVTIVSAPHAPLSRALEARLPIYDIGYVSPIEASANVIGVQLSPENLERRLLSVFATGQVAEYELVYTVNYSVSFPGFEPILAEFEVLREYQDDPNQALAKSRELDLIVSEMREEAADRILRLLPSQASALGYVGQ